MPPKPHVRRYQDRKVLYDLDFTNAAYVLRQRIYKSEDGTIQTPITPLFEAREVAGDTIAPAGRSFDPRYCLSCFLNPQNQDGLSRLKSLIPYRPVDPDHQAHVAELLAFPGVESTRYFGEVHTRSIEPYT